MWLFTGGPEPTAFHLMDEGKPHRRKIFVLPDQAEARSGRAPQAVARRAAVIGAGSVGSKIAEILVRSGISNLTLVDGDVMLPGNTERRALDWRDVGFRKVHGLKRHLLHISPGADITVIDQNLNWQRSARVHASQTASIAECDLIINAAGDAATSLFLGAVAAANNRPFISVEVYEGGIGALIASCLPGRSKRRGRRILPGAMKKQAAAPSSRTAIRCTRRRRYAHGRGRCRRDHGSQPCRTGGA